MASAFDAIRAIDYTVIFRRDLPAMRAFYGDVMRFALVRELTPNWMEYKVGSQTLALCHRGDKVDGGLYNLRSACRRMGLPHVRRN